MTRVAAINTVKRWVPDHQPMDAPIRAFALRLLKRLMTRAKPEVDQATPTLDTDGIDVKMADGSNLTTTDIIKADATSGDVEAEEPIKTPYLPDTLAIPAQSSEVLQHVQLLFALSVKVPQFLDE